MAILGPVSFGEHADLAQLGTLEGLKIELDGLVPRWRRAIHGGDRQQAAGTNVLRPDYRQQCGVGLWDRPEQDGLLLVVLHSIGRHGRNADERGSDPGRAMTLDDPCRGCCSP